VPRAEPTPAASQEPQPGLRCRGCGCGDLRVIYTRHRPGGKILRRRECRHCKKRFTTFEREATP
jgi:transcriptional regulator NrdR family protein